MEKKLSSDDINSVCSRLITTNESDALWVSSLAIQAAMRRGPGSQTKRVMGLRTRWPPKDLAFFPLHKKDHWSLLVLYRSKGMNHLYHYDSVPGFHAVYAVGVVTLLCDGGLLASKEVGIHRASSFPKQRSNWECGWYLIRAVQMILESAESGGMTRMVPGRQAKKVIRIPGML